MADDQEIYNLVHRKTKVPRMTPLPDIDRFRNDNFRKNRLRKFRVGKVGPLQVYDQPETFADRSNVQTSCGNETDDTVLVPGPPMSFYHKKMKECANRIPTEGLLPDWEKNILDLVPKVAKNKYPEILNRIVRETKVKYSREMHDFGIRMILAPGLQGVNRRIAYEEHPFKYNGHSEHRRKFIKNRKSIANQYFLSHFLIRGIVVKAYFSLPRIIFDFGRYRQSGLLEIYELNDMLAKDLRKGALIITNQYYGDVRKLISRPKCVQDVPAKKLKQFIGCATRLFVQQILSSMMETIERMIEFLGDPQRCPRVKFELLCEENELCTEPGVEDMYSIYHQIIDDVANIAQELIPLEEWMNVKTKQEYIVVKLPDWFIRRSHDKLQEVLEENFRPLNDYLSIVAGKFRIVCASETKTNVMEFVSAGRDFDEYCAKVDKFNVFVSQANEMVANEYYAVGSLGQSSAKASLKERAMNIIDIIVEELVSHHQKFNLSICSEFEDMKHRALEIPNNTKDLFELGDYISYASEDLMKELTEKIRWSIQMLGSLIQITSLTEEHMELNKITFNWLEAMNPVFEKNGTLCEAMKCEMEDELQRRINVLNGEVDDIFPKLVILDDMDDAKRIQDYMEHLRVLAKTMDQIDEQIRWINLEERLFKFPETLFPKVVEIKEMIIPFYFLIHLIYNWQRDHSVWLNGPFEYLDATMIERKTADYLDKFTANSKSFKTKIKMDIAASKPYRFSGIVDDPDPMQQPAPLKLCWQVLGDVNSFQQYVPLAICMCNPALVKRHWDEMSTIAGFDLTPNAGTTLRKIIAFDLMNNIEIYEIISIGANKELALQQQLSQMIEEWDPITFTVRFLESTGVSLLTDLDAVDILLAEHLVKIHEMRGSYFVRPIESMVMNFLNCLLTIQGTIEEWTRLQGEWLNLLPIFSCHDTATQLTEENDLFWSVDATLRSTMEQVSQDPTVRRIAGSPILLETLQRANERIERVNQGVRTYLDIKRSYFPRFYFLSDNDILLLLFQCKNPLKIQSHLKKCFEGIERLGVDTHLNIHSVMANDGERLKLEGAISTTGVSDCIEKWLVKVEEKMISALRRETRVSYLEYNEKSIIARISDWPGMAVLCASQIHWTMEVQNCLMTYNSGALEAYLEVLSKQLVDMVAELKNRMPKRTRGILAAMIVLGVHKKEIVKTLIEENVIRETDFNWHTQLRYYWVDKDIEIMALNATMNYGFEYLGNQPRLVVTPLTDRCNRTVMEAYHHRVNAAFEGPAGTGKSETFKDLARAIAVQCIVINCTNRLNYYCMGKLFKGLSSRGAWACFDDFNRIDVEVLSVAAQQIFCITQAVRSGVKRFIFEGTELILNPAVCVCVTMNPGYPGRSDLPDNLRLHFRTVSMMVPEFTRIIEVELFAAGFSSAESLAVKIVTMYKLCSEQLSSESHYDYGMRSVKCVVRIATKLKIRYPHEDEKVILLRSLIDANVPKFLERDLKIFLGIVSDLFPDVSLPPPNYKQLLKALREVCEKRHLCSHEVFEMKAIQMFEMIHIRQAFMIVGVPFGGKTSVLHSLADALCLLHKWGEIDIGSPTEFETINPTAIAIDRLFGQVDESSSKWKDGILSVIFRAFTNNEAPGRKWLIFDGPADSVWIENLNTVLDDNKTLCLASGERIATCDSMSIIFEVMDLNQASPATVSRCGMIHFEPECVGWRPFVASWMVECNWSEGHQKVLQSLFDWLTEPCLVFIRKNCTLAVTAGQIHQVVSTLNLLEMYLKDAIEYNTEDRKEHLVAWSQAAMVQSFVWGAAGALNFDSRGIFDAFLVSLLNGTNTEFPVPATVNQFEISLPNEGLIHDNFYTFKGKGVWKHWGDTLKSERLVETRSIEEMVVPTIDTVKYINMFNRHIKHRKRFLLCGDTATGKSFYTRDLLINRLSQEQYLSNFFTFTAKITASQAQDLFLSKLNKRTKAHYGPPKGKFCITFIDDVNMPAGETSGAQPALELLRQFFDRNHWYHLTENEKIFIHDVMFVSAMTLGGNNGDICPRFLRHFNLYFMNTFSKDSMFRIFSNVLLISLKRNNFNQDVLSIVNSIVNATINVYTSAIIKLRPIPTKFYYLFNIRDISRVITGCALIHKDSVEIKITFVRLFVHECLRVFGDRLVDDDDKTWLFLKIKDSVKNFFKDTFEAAFDHLPKFEDHITVESLRDLIFGSFMDVDAIPENRKYEEINSMAALKNKALVYLERYNNTHALKMDIVLFRYVLEHLARICRVLATPGGNLLMVCVAGSGRRSLARLATCMAHQNLFEPAVGALYDLSAWRNDIKRALKNSGGTGQDLAFFITDRQMNEAFLQDIDSLLTSGEVPNIFTIEEKQEIIEMTRLPAQCGNRNLEISILAVMDYFVNRCKEKLHLIISFSPIGNIFRTSLRSYASLTNCCTMNRLESWPEDGLEQVAVAYLKTVNIHEDIKAKSVAACKYFHNCAEGISREYYEDTRNKTYVTSSAFLHLVRNFADLMVIKQEETTMARNRYLGGLEKLQFAADQVGEMKATLTALRPQLELSAQQTAATMQEIESENISVEKATILVKKDEEIANRKAGIAAVLRVECEADLAVAIPILEDAIAALNTLKPADITLVKAMKNPPDTVKLVMAAVCVMLNVPPDRSIDPATGKKITDYWGASKRILGDMNFLQNLKDYQKDNIPVALMQVIKKTYMTDKSFMPNIVAKASSAAEGLCKWVRAMVSYDEIAKVVAPKKEKLAAAQKECDQTEAFLNAKRKTLSLLNEKLAVLNDSLQATLAKKMDLEIQVRNCTNKLVKAENLISSLGGEKRRWMQCAENLQKSYDNLTGDMLLSCGMIAYLGPYSTACRIDNLEKWKTHVESLDIPGVGAYDFTEILGSKIKISSWSVYGLPKDRFSVENAVIMENSKLWSLFIDPQCQANKWIRRMERSNGLQIIKLSDENYMEVLESSIECGNPVLLENIEEILKTSLDPILSKNIYKVGETWCLDVGEKTFEYCRQFRLYITTKLQNPSYSPDVFNKVTVIDFTLTSEGLEDQLLDIVAAKESPNLQEKLENLLIQTAANKIALKQEEDNILSTLSASNCNILEDVNAIQILDSSKTLSIDIVKRQKAIEMTREEINIYRQSYKPFAKHSAALYCTITGLVNLNPMYQFSLPWFVHLYVTSIETSNRSVVLKRRLDFLREAFTKNLYSSVCRCLFEKDKLMYSFVLYMRILLDIGQVTQEEMKFLTTGGVDLVFDTLPNPSSTWLPDKSWEEICRVSIILPSFKNFMTSFRSAGFTWQQYYDSANPQHIPLPQPWDDELTPFQKLIVMRIIRPDKLIVKIVQFVEDGIGKKFVTPPPFDISKSYEESNCLVPLIFILSNGSEPISALSKFADKVGYSSRFFSISLGQGQERAAESLIERGQQEGWWIFLQNCHLAVSWMPRLEKICERWDATNTSLEFRLWLSSCASDKFPVAILQNGVKMTNDLPTGLRQSLMRSYNTEPINLVEFFDGCPGKDKAFSQLLYGLCFFHAVVRERGMFGPQGWNIAYEFDDSDLHISIRQLQIFINGYNEVPFSAIRYFVGECNYGGRITDAMDRRCLNTILTDFCNPRINNDSSYAFASGPEYSLPTKCEYRDYVRHVESIPRHPEPEVFGLHANTSIVRNLNSTKELLNSMSLTQGNPNASSDNDECKRDLVLSIKRDISERLPESFDVEDAHRRYPFTYKDSMNTVIVQETGRYNRILEEMKNSLSGLDEALQGLIIMTPALEELAEELLVQRVPNTWEKACSYPTAKHLSNFLDNLLQRLAFVRKWLDEGPPDSFWLPGFSSCSAFLSAARQNFARESHIPIENIDLDYQVLPVRELVRTTSDPNGGIHVHGLYLSGARWDVQRMMLAESLPKVLYDRMPVICFKPTRTANVSLGSRYETPLYTTHIRKGNLNSIGRSSNHILSVPLDTDKPVSHWTKRESALLCQPEDYNW